MITYLIEVSICWLLFYGIYILLLRKETFFNINRWYLLTTLGLGLVIPMFRVDFTSLFYTEPASVVYLAEGFSELEYVIADSVEKAQEVDYSWLTFVKAIYFLGVFIAFSKFLYGFRQIYSLYRTGAVTQKGKYKLVVTEKPHLPFSFFNYLFWHKDTALEDTDSGKIITHELAHINQWHSLDVLFLEILGILLWFSPPIYWYKKSLRAVHEFLADAYVLRDTKKKQYGHLLIRQVQSGMQISLANNFIHSQLKQRINMMTRNQSRRKELMRYLPALPLLLLMVLVFSNKNVQHNFNETKVKAGLVFENIWEGDFDPKVAKEKMQVAFRDGSNGWFTESGEAMDLDVQKMKELHRECKRQIVKFSENESAIKLLMMEVAAENGYKVSFSGADMRYSEIKEFKKGEAIKMQIDEGNLPTSKILTDTPPIFPGGEKEMLRFIYRNIKYPAQARAKGIYGNATIQFVVEKDGSISNLQALGDVGGGIQEELLRIGKLIKNFPTKWTPAKKNGEAISAVYELPIAYRLEGENADGTPFTMKDNGSKKDNAVVVIGYYKGDEQKEKKQADPIFKEVDEMPRYPGCEEGKMSKEALTECAQNKMLTFIYTNIKYPEQARKQGIEGTVVVKFVVDKTGKITTKELVRGIGGRTGEEVLRVVGEMPNWIPGQKDGKAVSVFYHLPVKFKLSPDAKKELKDLSELRMEGGAKRLYIVNGEEFKGELEDLNPDDIVTIDVKGEDAETVKKYGDKAKNGVVEIQLKSDKTAKKVIKDLEKDLPELKINGNKGAKPLHIVNGEEFKGDLNELNPDDIESINVVKGEAAFKKYGDKGKNGVVEIKLKGKKTKKKGQIPTQTASGEKIFKVVDNMPLFPGCDATAGYSETLRNCANQKMLEFIYQNVKYPAAARKEGIEGVVVVRFLVEKDGAISGAEILRNVGGGTGEEALRVVNLMKEQHIKWIPGEQDGKKVNVNFNLPVKFKLADDVKEELESKKEEKKNIIYHPEAPQIPIGYKEETVTFDGGKKELTLNVFPNPVQDQLSVTLQGAAKNIVITVFDITGKAFFREKVNAFDGVLHKTVDLQNATKGTLIVNVRHKGKDYQKKVIMQ